MSAQTVLDSVNKYRHGVLIGNFVEDQFGNDLAKKGPNPDPPKLTTTKQFHDLDHSLYKRHEIIDKVQPTNKTFYETSKGFSAYGSYKKPEQCSTYNIFYQAQPMNKLSNLQNNSKKQDYLNKKDMLYEDTKYHLQNRFGGKTGYGVGTGTGFGAAGSRSGTGTGFGATTNLQGTNAADGQEIPDILTGQMLKTKNSVSGGPQSQNTDKNLQTRIDPSKASTKAVNPYSVYSIVKPQIQKFEDVEYQKLVKPNAKGEKRDVLFGHGIILDDFHKRQLGTTYDLSFNQKIKPQTQINSFFEPGLTQTCKHFHRETLYEKTHQADIPAYGTKQVFYDPKVHRPYDPYTKTFDRNHMKTEYLRK